MTESERPKTEPKPRPAHDVATGDEVRMRKSHPCGSFDWRVVRVGADIGLRCLGCDHKVLLPRSVFERRFKSYLRRANLDTTYPAVSTEPH